MSGQVDVVPFNLPDPAVGRGQDGVSCSEPLASGSCEALYAALRPRLLRVATGRFAFSTDEAEDIVQDVFEALLIKRPRMRDPQAYLVGMLYNRCRDRAVTRSRQRSREVGLDAVDPADDREVERIQAACAVAGAYRLIDPDCRRLLQGYFVAGWSLEEIARITGRPLTTTWNRVKGCLGRMLSCLRA